MVLLLESETEFGLSLLRQQNLNESLVFSPLSISLALSLVHEAAKGETKSQIKNVIAKGATDEQLKQHFSNISRALLSAEKETKVNVANHVYARVDHPLKPEYLKNVGKLYKAGASSLDFGDKEATANIEFLTARNVDRSFAENKDWQVLSLPYEDKTFAFHVFLPNLRFGLQATLENLDAKTIQFLIGNTTETFLDIRIPKMHIESSFNLLENLEQLGIRYAFDENADLSVMGDNLYVSKVSHKAVIDVDEDGTTAAAATSDFIDEECGFDEEAREFRADHPFVFVLTKDNHPLFIGIYN